MEMNKQFEEMLGPSFYPHECGGMIECITKQEAMKAMQKAFNLGKNSKKCKEDKDNPYNIDYARQTKLDF